MHTYIWINSAVLHAKHLDNDKANYYYRCFPASSAVHTE